jgi:hypothetical protein
MSTINTLSPKLSMILAGVEITTPLRIEEIQDLTHQTSMNIEEHLKDILINEFIANNKYLTKFIQLENRERNLNQLLNEETDMGL